MVHSELGAVVFLYALDLCQIRNVLRHIVLICPSTCLLHVAIQWNEHLIDYISKLY